MTISDFTTLITYLLTTLADLLNSAPIIYFVGLALVCVVINIVLKITISACHFGGKDYD